MSLFTNIDDLAMGVYEKVFGEPVLYTFRDNAGVELQIPGIFSAVGTVIETSGDVAVESRHPVLGIRKSRFINAGLRLPKKGDEVDIDGVTYTVISAPATDNSEAEMRLVLMKKGNYEYA